MPIRKHLYKAKRKDNGEWVKGFFSMMTKGAYLDPIENGCYITTFEKLKNGEIILSKIFEVIPETVCECTGMSNKNGAEIFEGDLIKDKSDLVWLVAFEKGAFVCKDEEYRTYFNFYEHKYFDDYEVIGNIFDNPELLEARYE